MVHAGDLIAEAAEGSLQISTPEFAGIVTEIGSSGIQNQQEGGINHGNGNLYGRTYQYCTWYRNQ